MSRRVQLRRDVTPSYDVDNDVQFDGRQKGDLYVSPLTRFSDIYCQRYNMLESVLVAIAMTRRRR